MKRSATLDWFAAKWDLPEPAFESVRRLLRAEAGGSTAIALEDPLPDFGRAAAPAGETASTPLVLVQKDGVTYLQSRRLFETERTIAARLLALAGAPSLPGDVESLFPGVPADDRQREAARLAATGHLTLITGGPGTGKTYVLARILALLADPQAPVGGIRLAAPTGKAADRMKKAVTESLTTLPEPFRSQADLLARIAETSGTLHSLLGYNPDKGRCQYGKNHPLPCDTLIVDECSMVDVHLWRALLEALPPQARLVLLGDPNQLESVGQGNVFADLARAAAAPPLRAVHVHLTEARRFKDSPGLVALARAFEQRDDEAAAALLEASRGSKARDGLAWIPARAGVLPCEAFPSAVLAALERVAAAPTPGDALAALQRVCILTAQREFFVGSKALGLEVERHLARRTPGGHRPVIINRNDPETGLRNGAVGIVSRAPARRAFFPGADGTLRDFALASLPEHSPAWAITIHRSQGSEYDDVLVILPREESPMATRELLYTAITRARRNVYVAGDLAAVRKAATTTSPRCTLLEAFLRDSE